MRAPRCARCRKPIAGDILKALGKQWHPQCFVCEVRAQQGCRSSRLEDDGRHSRATSLSRQRPSLRGRTSPTASDVTLRSFGRKSLETFLMHVAISLGLRKSQDSTDESGTFPRRSSKFRRRTLDWTTFACERHRHLRTLPKHTTQLSSCPRYVSAGW
jgi:hypothetical protein